METKHTPGPWYLIATGGADFTAIATKQIPEYTNDFDAEVLGSSEWLRVKDADLKLMAAAPKLLAALAEAERLYSSYALTASGGMEVGAWINAARDAITEATA